MTTKGLSQMAIDLTHHAGQTLDVVFVPSDVRDGPRMARGIQCNLLSWLDHYQAKFGLMVTIPHCKGSGPVWMAFPWRLMETDGALSPVEKAGNPVEIFLWNSKQ